VNLSDVVRQASFHTGTQRYFGTATADRLYKMIRSESFTEPTLATLFWQIAARSRGMSRAMSSAGVEVSKNVELFVTRGGLNRFDVVAFDHNRPPSAAPAVGFFEASRQELDDAWSKWRKDVEEARIWQAKSRDAQSSELDAGVEFEERPGPPWSAAEILDSVDRNFAHEVAKRGEFRVIVIGAPETLLTAALPAPAMAICESPSGPTSGTAGLIARDESGTVGLTCALHALVNATPGALVQCGPQRGILRSVDAVSDSAFIEVDGLVSQPRNVRGVLSGVSPRQGPAHFEGITSGRTDTMVTSWSPDLLLVQPYNQVKVLTKPSTAPGDSGCALVDDEGYVLGFSFYRTGLNEAIEYSAWIWADSVMKAHRLS